MSFFWERRAALTRCQVTLQTTRGQMDQARQQIAAGKTNLDALPVQLKTLIEDIATAGNGDNLADKTLAAEALILLDEVSTLSAKADAQGKALDSVS